ncbi:YoaK family protein [Alicyclobacillus acidocaldarius]|uniref:DUF1275 domain-containing protein n=1 Tax=Alicyclobacillus acidocaldarius subsp. acidocaldarius (strain ATCC 27009 / DSM 446 / BCRC 14685 / JCM 5260 / KCTC 1825 / NBRC 15652 / NCIMB 11725 / NRRL B-14509 / 104-IA) TaxID=521098 RepID=C8WUG1_ALIAD|nr:YoaK family protein [Alicyclobacillus acidocaldarius]ACV59777.1 protein of unknown function DUF1275 [Alicyclobacillus acidocaldarius subsp. acidocaldarius DSM 446]
MERREMSAVSARVFLLVLTAVSGCVDAMSFMRLGQVFTAAMTGNTVLGGIAVAAGDFRHAVHYLVALVGFACGAAASGLVAASERKRSGWSRTVTHALWLELAALVAFWIAADALGPAGVVRHTGALLFALAFGMGAQGSMARRVGINGITTTVITSTTTGLMETLVWKLMGLAPSRRNPSEPFDPTKPWLVWMWVLAVVIYGVGAGVASLVIAHAGYNEMAIPVALVVITIAWGMYQTRPKTEPAPGRRPAVDR